MKFIADGMLGKLTRWLRILGYNVKYSNKLDDAQISFIAENEQRILLTKDLRFYHQVAAKGISAFYLGGRTEGEKLAELSKRFGISLEIDVKRSRCTKCNIRVRSTPKEKVAKKVKEGTFAHYNNFWQCPKCGQIYWQGTHWVKIRRTLEEAKENRLNI